MNTEEAEYQALKGNQAGISCTMVSKLLFAGQIWPRACFCMAHELSLDFTFLKGCKEKKKTTKTPKTKT